MNRLLHDSIGPTSKRFSSTILPDDHFSQVMSLKWHDQLQRTWQGTVTGIDECGRCKDCEQKYQSLNVDNSDQRSDGVLNEGCKGR
jgi:hypothetical protein